MTVGSDCSRMPSRSRLTKTDAISGRSAALPDSFSTIDARISASYGFLSGSVARRASPTPSSSRERIRRCARVSNARSVEPVAKKIRVGKEPALGARRPACRRGAQAPRRAGRARTSRCCALAVSAATSSAYVEPSTIVNRGLRHVALRQLVEQLRQRDALGDLVVACLDRAIDAVSTRRQRDERVLRRQHAGATRSRATDSRLAPAFTSKANGEAGRRQRLRGPTMPARDDDRPRRSASRTPRRVRTSEGLGTRRE